MDNEGSCPTDGIDPMGSTESLPPPGRPGSALDADGYRVLQKIGEGGMGEVYVAEQLGPIRRTVALKVIKPGMDSRQVVARFESERQALAMMDHPCIATVLDAGTTRGGRLYFAMEHVSGVSITEYCDTQRLTVRERLELFIQVCEGVQHAHQKAIIHRDLKPSNVLVTVQNGRPLPKIIDFGVAKAITHRLTDTTMFTELGQLIGTPEYMSPEQAEMTGQDVDTRTDIYALGAMLYELLTGALPFDGRTLRSRGFDEIRRTIREQEPPRPTTRLRADPERATAAARSRHTSGAALVRQLRGDLEWITLKAMEKDRTRRYATAAELAADVRRHLENRPVVASPPGAAYRFGKLVRRHRAVFVSAGAAALALVLGLAVATVGFVRASRERDRKEVALTQATAVTGFLADMLAATSPGKEGRQVTVREVLDRASGRIDGAFAAQPLVAARLHTTVGTTYQALGLFDEAATHLERALDIRRRTLGDDDPATLAAMDDLANLDVDRGRFQAAEALARESLAARRRGGDADGPQAQRSIFILANIDFHQGRYAEAAAHHEEVLQARTRTLGANDPATLFAMANLASDYWAEGRLAKAEPLYEKVVEGRRRRLGPDHPDTLDAMNNLAALYHLEHRWTQAETLYRQALDASIRVRGRDHPDSLVLAGNLAELLADRGRYGEAEPLLEDVVARKRRVLGEDHPSTLYSMAILARTYRAGGELARARRAYTEVLAARRRVQGPGHPDTMAAMQGLVGTEVAQGDESAARPLLSELIHLRRRAADAPNASPKALDDCATLLLTCRPTDLRDPRSALAYASRAQALTGDADPGVLDTLAAARFANGDAAGAAAAQRQALASLPATDADATAYRGRLERYSAAAGSR